MTKAGLKFKQEMEKIDEEIAIIAGKPLDQLTDKEKQDVIIKWTITRNAPNKKKPFTTVLTSYLAFAVVFTFFGCLLLLALKWFFHILGVM